MRKIMSRLAPIGLGVAVGLLLLAPFVTADDLSVEARRCGAGPDDTVAAEFSIPSASGVWKQFPAMLRAPELEMDDRPASVVRFSGDYTPDGPVTGNPMSGSTRPASLAGALCVIQADGTVNLYHDVSRNGSRFAP